MTLLEHLKDERDWLRNRISVVSQMIAQMERGETQTVSPNATITSAAKVVEVTYTQRGE
jgi:hypothetical protein